MFIEGAKNTETKHKQKNGIEILRLFCFVLIFLPGLIFAHNESPPGEINILNEKNKPYQTGLNNLRGFDHRQ